MIETGKVTNVIIVNLGSELAEDAGIGAETLTVEDSYDFNEDGGQLEMEDETILVYTEVDFDNDVITLAEPLAAAYTINQAVLVVPHGSTKKAMVEFDDGDEGLLAAIPFSMHAQFEDGIRDINDQEAVMVSDENGRWEITAVDEQIPSISGEYFDPETFPETVPPEAPPGTSPEIQATGTTASIVVRALDEIAPTTRIQYHIKPDDGGGSLWTPTEATRAFTTKATVAVITELPDGSGLDAETTYLLKAVAENDAGVSLDESEQVTAQLNLDVIDTFITATLVAGFILTGRIQIGQAYIDANEGIVIPQPNGDITKFTVDGLTASRIAGIVDIVSGTVQGTLDVNSLLRMYGNLELQSGVQNPSVPASLSYGWDSLTFNILDGDAPYLNGLAEDLNDSTKWLSALAKPTGDTSIRKINKSDGVVSAYAGGSWDNGFHAEGGIASAPGVTTVRNITAINRSPDEVSFSLDGPPDGLEVGMQVTVAGAVSENGVHTVIALGPTSFTASGDPNPLDPSDPGGGTATWSTDAYYVLGWDANRSNKWYIYRLNDTLTAKTDEVYIADSFPKKPTIGVVQGAAEIVIAWWAGSGLYNWRFNSTNLNAIGGSQQLIAGGTPVDLGGVHYGAADYGATRITIAARAGQVYVFSTGAVRQNASEFLNAGGQAIRGLYWHGSESRFYHISDAEKVWKYATGHPLATTPSVAHTEYDGNATGGTHETMISPPVASSWPARAKLVVSVPAAPEQDKAGNDVANQKRVYVQVAGTYRLQATLAVGVKTANLETINAAGAAAPVANGFAAVNGGTGTLKSRVTDGIGALIDLVGDGSGRVGPLRWTAAGVIIATEDFTPSTDWAPLTINAPYSAVAGAQAPMYKRDAAGNVWIDGAVTRGTATTATTCFTLPVGFRPTKATYRMVRTNAAGGVATIEIATTGVATITFAGTPTTLGLECMFSTTD